MSLDITYYSFSPSRADSNWQFIKEDLVFLREKNHRHFSDKNIEKHYQNTKQESIKHVVSIDYLVDKEATIQQKKEAIKFLDLFYGSPNSQTLDDGKLEMFILDAMEEARGLEPSHGGTLPTKKEWVELFTGLNQDLLYKITKLMARELEWPDDEAYSGLVWYLQQIRPVIKDLKENEDSIFVSHAGGVDIVEPSEVENLLKQRAEVIFLKLESLFKD